MPILFDFGRHNITHRCLRRKTIIYRDLNLSIIFFSIREILYIENIYNTNCITLIQKTKFSSFILH